MYTLAVSTDGCKQKILKEMSGIERARTRPRKRNVSPEVGRPKRTRTTLEGGKATRESFDDEKEAFVKMPASEQLEDTTEVPKEAQNTEKESATKPMLSYDDSQEWRERLKAERDALVRRFKKDVKHAEEEASADKLRTVLNRIEAKNKRHEEEEQAKTWLVRAFPSLERVKEWLHTDVREMGANKPETDTDYEAKLLEMGNGGHTALQALQEVSSARSKEAEKGGFLQFIENASERYRENFLYRNRVAIGIALAGIGAAVTAGALPVALAANIGVMSVAPAVWRGVVAAGAGVVAASFISKKTQAMESNSKRIFLVGAGGFVTMAAVFAGGQLLAEQLGPLFSAYFESGNSADAALASVSGADAVGDSFVDLAPPESVPADVITSGDVASYADETIAGDPEPVAPEVTDTALEAPASDANSFEIRGDMNVWSALTDSVNDHLADQGTELTDQGMRGLAQAVHEAAEATGAQSVFLEKGGEALSGLAWEKIPDGTTVHFDRLFGNEEFMEKLQSLLESGKFRTLRAEIGGKAGVQAFLEKLATGYGA